MSTNTLSHPTARRSAALLEAVVMMVGPRVEDHLELLAPALVKVRIQHTRLLLQPLVRTHPTGFSG
jgi:hypothetical protein